MRNFKVYKSLSLWVLSLLSLLYAADYAFGFFLLQNRDMKSSYVTTTKINADVLILGSCEARSTINPAVLEEETGLSAYNLATNHSLPSEMYGLLYLYISHNEKPAYVVFQFSEDNFDRNFQVFHTYRFAHIHDSEIKELLALNAPEYYRLFKFPFLRYAVYNNLLLHKVKEGFRHWAGRIEPENARGYFYNTWGQFVSQEGVNKKYGTEFYYNNDAEEVAYLHKMLQLCTENNIEVRAFRLPIWCGMDNILMNRQEINQEIAAVFAAYDVHYQCLTDEECWQDSRLYYIPFLLNAEVCDSLVRTELAPMLH